MSNQTIDLEEPRSRAALPRRFVPYFVQLAPGLAIGYRRGINYSTWRARLWIDGGYRALSLGKTDDVDGTPFAVTYKEAVKRAKAWARGQVKASKERRA